MDRYALYARVSTEEQGESGLGLEAQRAIAFNFYPQIEREFIEVASGKDVLNRPVLKQAMDYCRAEGIVLVVAKVDRLSRSVVDGLTILEQMGGKIRFCDMPGEVDKFMLTLFFAFAQRERELISIRTKAALAEKKKAGIKLGGPRRLTAEDSAKGGRAVAMASRANRQNVRAREMALLLREKGLTLEQVAQRLNDAEFRTSRGNKWNKTTVLRLCQLSQEPSLSSSR